MSLRIVSFTNEDKEVLLRLILVAYILSFSLQVTGFSVSEWICEQGSLHCVDIFEIDGKIKGLLITSFTLKCLTCLWLIIYFSYKFTYNTDNAWAHCMDSYRFTWRLWVLAVTISEILSGTVFVLMLLHNYGLGWSAYLYSLISFLLVVSAGIITSVRVMWFIVDLLEPCDNNNISSRDSDIWPHDIDVSPSQSASLLGQSTSARRSSQRTITDTRVDVSPSQSTSLLEQSTSARRSSQRTITDTRVDVSPSQSTSLLEQSTSARRSSQRTLTDTDDEECCVCMERQVDVELPCSHKLCRRCARKIKKYSGSLCPFDRKYFPNFIRISRW